MKKLLNILKINGLALIAIPLLLLATAFKLISKALEKLVLLLILTVVAVVTILVLNSAIATPESFLTALITIAIGIAAFGLFFIIMYWLFSLISGMLSVAWTLMISVFDHLYDLTYTAYLHLYTSCESDYRLLSLNGKKAANAICCPFFSILKVLSRLIITLVTIALPVGILASLFVVAVPILSMRSKVKTTFGLGLFQFLGKYNVGSILIGALVFIVLVGIFVTVIMALSLEWYEWGQELKCTDEEISDEITKLTGSQLRIASGKADEVEKNMTYFNKVQAHMDSLNALGQKVTELLDAKDNPLLRSAWGIYMRNLSPIVEVCSNQKGISSDRFKQLIPQIQLLDKQRSDVQGILDKMEKELANPAGASTFFVGCDTLEKLEKRYKSLSKTYHPDMAEGDTATFQKMKQEYDTIKAAMAPAKN